jgi:hypothetical protein
MKYKQDLEFYYQACNEVAKMFAKQYFCDKNTQLEDLDYWWVGDSIGGVSYINDYFWNMEDMVEALKSRINRKTLFEFYDWSTDEMLENKSLYYFLRLKKLNIPVECVSDKKNSTGKLCK